MIKPDWICTKSKYGIDGGHTVVAVVAPHRGDRALVIHSPSLVNRYDADEAAMLIAAAPDLLAALKAMLRLHYDQGTASAKGLGAVRQARAAIAKATKLP